MRKQRKKSYYCGLDLSLLGTGIVVINSDANIVDQSLLSSSSKLQTEERIMSITESIKRIIEDTLTDIVYVEGLAFGARGSKMFELAALHYYVRIFLFKNNHSYKVIPPQTVKKFVTGKGSAKKELMLLQVYKKWKVSFENNNVCDAYCLARYALNQETLLNKE